MPAFRQGIWQHIKPLCAKKWKVDLLLDSGQTVIEIGFPRFVLPVCAEEQ